MLYCRWLYHKEGKEKKLSEQIVTGYTRISFYIIFAFNCNILPINISYRLVLVNFGIGFGNIAHPKYIVHGTHMTLSWYFDS